ncbi:MAG TPA: hypothetical protein VJV79_04410 [Polyangiaceae bacterium]|nr:hypothetical protein [Polyangiaceae bacterium]
MSQNFYPFSAYNSTAGKVTGIREAVGEYFVLFQNLFIADGSPMVSMQTLGLHGNPYGKFAHQGGTQWKIACFNAAGSPADSEAEFKAVTRAPRAQIYRASTQPHGGGPVLFSTSKQAR